MNLQEEYDRLHKFVLNTQPWFRDWNYRDKDNGVNILRKRGITEPCIEKRSGTIWMFKIWGDHHYLSVWRGPICDIYQLVCPQTSAHAVALPELINQIRIHVFNDTIAIMEESCKE